jgi:hypothetical protein
MLRELDAVDALTVLASDDQRAVGTFDNERGLAERDKRAIVRGLSGGALRCGLRL